MRIKWQQQICSHLFTSTIRYINLISCQYRRQAKVIFENKLHKLKITVSYEIGWTGSVKQTWRHIDWFNRFNGCYGSCDAENLATSSCLTVTMTNYCGSGNGETFGKDAWWQREMEHLDSGLLIFRISNVGYGSFSCMDVHVVFLRRSELLRPASSTPSVKVRCDNTTRYVGLDIGDFCGFPKKVGWGRVCDIWVMLFIVAHSDSRPTWHVFIWCDNFFYSLMYQVITCHVYTT